MSSEFADDHDTVHGPVDLPDGEPITEETTVERELVVEERERAVAYREQAIGEREEGVLQRDEAADRRDSVALGREEHAQRRDETAENLDAETAERDRLAVSIEASHHPSLQGAAIEALATARRGATLDRARAGRDRHLAAGDRRRSEADRVAAASDRKAAADDRAAGLFDHLTGVLLRGSGFFELNREIARAQRAAQTLVLGFVDVVGLKAINDSDGHNAGDQVLRDVADALRTHLRPYDPIVRYGGDEFVCVLSGLSLTEAKDRLGAVNVALSEGHGHASVTIGLAELQPDDSLESLLQRADTDLYRQRHEQPNPP